MDIDLSLEIRIKPNGMYLSLQVAAELCIMQYACHSTALHPLKLLGQRA